MNLWTLCVMLSLEAHCPNPWVKLDAENLGTRTGSACTAVVLLCTREKRS